MIKRLASVSQGDLGRLVLLCHEKRLKLFFKCLGSRVSIMIFRIRPSLIDVILCLAIVVGSAFVSQPTFVFGAQE